MSQLSSGGRKNRAKNDKVNYKQIIYFLVAFAIICIIVTAICIFYTINGKKSENNVNESELNTDVNIEKISLDKKYFTNGIENKNVKYKEGDVVERFDGDVEDIYEYEISYEQISGLKNNDIQNKINKEIENEVKDLKILLEQNPKFERISISAYISASFSDVLSVAIDYSLIKAADLMLDEEADYKTGSVGLNYRLDTGEKLQFNDLFFNTSNIKQILNNSAYEAYAWQYAMDGETDFNMNLDNTNYGNIENKVFKILAEYNKNPDLDFYFTPKSIFAIIKDFKFEIDMKKYYEDISIYRAFIADNLYTDNSLKKEFYAFTDSYLTQSYEIENVKGTNFYYEIMCYSHDEVNVEVREKVQEKIDEHLQHYYEIAESNPDKGYMISVIYFYDTDPNSEQKYYQYDGYVTTMSLDYFNKNREKVIANARREERSELWSYDFSEVDKNIEFFEQFMAHAEDYNLEPEIRIETKADRGAI